MDFERSSGILLHPTSLPGKFGIGTLGKESFAFVDFLKSAGQKLWQMLPVGPTGYGNSPYQCLSAFAGNPLLISLEKLADDGLLSKTDLASGKVFPSDRVDFERVVEHKYPLLRKFFRHFQKSGNTPMHSMFKSFCQKQRQWLDDFSLFMALKDHFQGLPWWEWDHDIRFRTPYSIKSYNIQLADSIYYHKFLQFIFFSQWFELREYANKNHVRIIGDMPIFSAHDSADAWSKTKLFFFDKNLKPGKIAGVPPDYFSNTGQLWGNPLYHWKTHRAQHYAWWIDRFRASFRLFDFVRLDHFRGFAAYWAVPHGNKTAEKGKWEKGPGEHFFRSVEKKLGRLPLIAEDLGVITPDVRELRDHFHFPGMKILQFAFDSKETNDFLPHHFTEHCVVYTGTHDNNTSVGWYGSASLNDKKYAAEYLEILSSKEVSWRFIRSAWSSVAVFAIAPMQDLLSLGEASRMNIPGTGAFCGNWEWKMKNNFPDAKITLKIKNLTEIYGR